MAYYNRRDLIGHWVKRTQPTQRMCNHACCRGKRVHPDSMPVILPNRLLRRASDDDLAEHYARVSADDSPAASEGRAQVLYEMERRDVEQQRKREHAEAVSATRSAREWERASERERVYLQAEEYTRGNWVNAAGREAGISDREILTGRQATFARYASDEARAYFMENPRPTAAYFRGEDTRYVPRYSSPRRRRSAGLPARPTRPVPARPRATRQPRRSRALGWTEPK